MRRICQFRLAAGAAAYLASTLVFGQFGSGPAALELVQVRDDLYMIYNDFVPGNVTALITDEGILLVDNKYPVDHDNIVALLASVTDQPIRYVINTHYHGDHSGSNALMQANDAEVIASDNARRKMVEANQDGLPNVTLDDHVRVYVGGIAVDAYCFGRSHTDGDVVVHFPEHGVISMGDMFTHGEGLPQLIDYSGGGSARAWTKSVDGALSLDFETVIPGHGLLTDRARLEAFREDTVRLQEMVRAMNRQQRSAADIEAMLRSEFGWQDLHVQIGMAGLIIEVQ